MRAGVVWQAGWHCWASHPCVMVFVLLLDGGGVAVVMTDFIDHASFLPVCNPINPRATLTPVTSGQAQV